MSLILDQVLLALFDTRPNPVDLVLIFRGIHAVAQCEYKVSFDSQLTLYLFTKVNLTFTTVCGIVRPLPGRLHPMGIILMHSLIAVPYGRFSACSRALSAPAQCYAGFLFLYYASPALAPSLVRNFSFLSFLW